jgi:cobalt-zinc-cadmium efflux system outer membrane protein
VNALRSLRTITVLGLIATSSASGQANVRVPDGAPFTLGDLLDRAVAQHPLVDAARARVRAAEGTRRTARSLGNPIITYQVENAPFPGRDAPAGMDREISTFATLPLEPIFQRGPRARRADEDVHAAEAELDLARRAVSLDASRVFYRVALAEAAVAGAMDVRDRLAELATYTEARTREGITSEGDFIRVQVELDRADAALALERVELARARGALAPYLGVEPANAFPLESIRVAVDTASMSTTTGGARTERLLAPLANYVARANARRPDLVAARARVAAARAEASYQRTLGVRQLGATIGTKRIGSVNTMIAGLSVPLPLFDQNRGEVQRASAERSAVALELAWRERQVAGEVAAAYEAARLLAEQRSRLTGSFIARAEESRRIALAAYREGAVGLLQVIDASRTLADARLAYYRTLFAERESLLELNVVSGSELLGPSPRSSTMTIDPSTDSRPAGRDGARP